MMTLRPLVMGNELDKNKFWRLSKINALEVFSLSKLFEFLW